MHSAASQTMEHPTEQQTPSEDELDRKKPWRRAVKRKREDAGRLGATKEAKKTRRVKKQQQQQQQRVQLETEKRQDPATEAPRRRDPAAEAFIEECMKDRVERKKKAKRERAEIKRAEKARARLEKKMKKHNPPKKLPLPVLPSGWCRCSKCGLSLDPSIRRGECHMNMCTSNTLFDPK